MKISRLLLPARVVLAATLALAVTLVGGIGGASPASATAYVTIEGTGSTWSQLIVEKWIADVDANGIKVVYTGGGSSKGRKDFSQDTVDFAISEIPYQGQDPTTGQADTSNGRDYAYLPIVAGGTSFTYQLQFGGQQVKNLRLSGETIAKIFTNQITDWSDPAIAADNPGRTFPPLPITPVVRADGSGTTAQFTAWMDNQYPSIWRAYNGGKAGLTSYYPIHSGTRTVGQAGSDQVMNTISSSAGNGTIGYVEYSYPKAKSYPVVKVLNKAGYYVEPTQYNTAVALTQAKINQDKSNPQTYLTQILTGVYNAKDPRAYPISSYSYMIIPTGGPDAGTDDPHITTAKRQTLADFLYYDLCAGQISAGDYGYSPLPLNLVQAGFNQIAQLKKADNAVDLTNRDVKSCNNPTFDGKNPNKNVLAEIAPYPEDCDKFGVTECGSDTGGGGPSPTATPTSGNGGGNTTNPGGGGGNTTNPGGNGGGNTTNPGGNGGTTPAPGATTTTNPDGTTTTTNPDGTTTTTNPDGTTTTNNSTGGNNSGGTGAVDANGQPVAPGAVDANGQPVVNNSAAQTSSGGTAYANPTLVSSEPLDSKTFGVVTVIELLALVLVPGIVVANLRRRRREGPGQ